MLWLALAFPDLGLAVHTRAQPPGSPPRPLALVAEGRVLACNAEAAAAGVAAGQRTAGAVALCPPLRFLEHQPAAAAGLLRQLAEACLAVTPTVVLAPPQGVLLEVEGCLQLFHGHAGLLRQLRRALRPLAVPYRLAQAPTPKAALALVASDLAEATLQLSAPMTLQDCRPLLQAVPVTALPWPPPLQQKLEALHLSTLGELFALPRPALAKRLGVPATRYLGQLLGELPDPQQAIAVAEDFQSTLYFLDGISHVEGLRFPMKRLLEDFCRFLRQRQWSCARFSWRFTHQDRSRQQLAIASARGEPQAARFMQLSELKLEHFRISAPVEAVTLVATEFQVQADTRLALLPEPGQEDEKALELLDRLRARLGIDACLRVRAEDSPRPEAEQALHREAAIGPLLDGVAAGDPPAPLRPFWIWPEAKALRVADGRLWWQGGFTLLSRPERIALPWWEEGDTRDYYLARHDNGAHYWLYFSHEQQAWFCQGLFG
jgi:protein ImuB